MQGKNPFFSKMKTMLNTTDQNIAKYEECQNFARAFSNVEY